MNRFESYLTLPTRRFNKRFPGLRRDLYNKFRYGFPSPLYMERIWVNPGDIEWIVDREEIERVTGQTRNQASGLVIDWDDINRLSPLREEFRVQYCLEHWVNGKSWDELGVYDYMSRTKKYGHEPMEKIKDRFRMLDKAFEETRKEGRLKTRDELDPSNYRESDGILIHIGKYGIPYFGGNGFHRLSIALALDLQSIPACVGVVDRQALPLLPGFRHK